MKKLTILFTFVFAVSMAMAQNNESTVNQTGNENEAYIDQIGADNDGTILQNNNYHYGIIDQTGLTNEASIDQSLTIHGGYGLIEQEGDRNDGDIVQTGNQYENGSYAKIYQFGNDNIGSQSQNVYGHPGLRRAYIYQDGDLNEAYQTQGQSGGGGDIYARSIQIGDDNKSIQNQAGSTGSKTSLFEQTGNYNFARTDQSGVLGGELHYARIWQSGNSNWAWISQGPKGQRAFVEQIDDNNRVASVNKNVDDLSFSGGSSAIQEGEPGNYINIFQDGEIAGVGNKVGFYQKDGAWADIDQIGDNNAALLWQNAGGDKANIFQSGLNNKTEVLQTIP